MALSLGPGDTGWQSRLSAGTWSLSADLAQETHLLLGSPSCSHQTYIMCALWEPGSQSALPMTRYSNPTRTGNPRKVENPLPGCDQYMNLEMVRRLSPSMTWCCQPRAETPIAMPCPETPRGLHRLTLTHPMAQAGAQTPPGCRVVAILRQKSQAVPEVPRGIGHQ